MTGTTDLPATIAAYDRDRDPPVVLDGTAPLQGLEWEKNTLDSNGADTLGAPPDSAERGDANTDVWTAAVPASVAPDGVWQLFDEDRTMWTPARWPNALFGDSSVFNITRWGAFDPTKPWRPALVPKHGPPKPIVRS